MAATLLSNRAMASLALNDYDSCIKDCEEAILLFPHNVKCFYRKAKAQLLLRRHGWVPKRGGGGFRKGLLLQF